MWIFKATILWVVPYNLWAGDLHVCRVKSDGQLIARIFNQESLIIQGYWSLRDLVNTSQRSPQQKSRASEWLGSSPGAKSLQRRLLPSMSSRF